MLPLWVALAAIKFVSWSTARTMEVQAPLCHRHAHGWFTWSGIEAREITDDRIVLAGVAEPFAQACAQRAAERSSPLRACSYCAAPNVRTARFCSQCGAVMTGADQRPG